MHIDSVMNHLRGNPTTRICPARYSTKLACEIA
jgi:hypothetical protein